ncbi:MAG: hypothetical protein RIT45_1089 [Pseudomonadota bacterium]
MSAGAQRQPWIIRTYAGFGDAASTNARFRDNLARGQRGLSVAFDLPTQCGYDADHAMARGEVGRTGVSVSHLGDMRELFEGIELGTANTSMTINATAPWLYALYLALADERGVPRAQLRGTTQNDMLKEFVARGTYVFEPDASFRLSRALILASVRHTPRWNPTNCCGYHLMESGARSEEEVGYAILGALFLLDAVRSELSAEAFEKAVSAISFFINSGIELVPEIAKVRAYAALWPAVCVERYGVKPRFRAGCQVRSLTLTAQQPEVNIVRIALSCLPVLASADARVGALQLPGFREALGLPDVAEQALALRTQQVWMHETGIADGPDIFAGSFVIESATQATMQAARAIIDEGLRRGYSATILDLSALLGRRMSEYIASVESGERTLVGVNAFEEAIPVARDGVPEDQPDAVALGAARAAALAAWRGGRDAGAWAQARAALIAAARDDGDVIEASVGFARAGGTTGEWTEALTEVFGARWSAPLGVDVATRAAEAVPAVTLPDGRRLRVLLAKAGLDGHTNALRLLAMTLRDAGAEVVWLGPGHAPEAIAHAAVSEGVDAIGLSSLSGAHGWIATAVRGALGTLGAPTLPMLMGGIIPDEDHEALRAQGVTAIFGPGARSADIVRAFADAASAG